MFISFIINCKVLVFYVMFYYSVMLFHHQTSISLAMWRIHGDIHMCSSSYYYAKLVIWYLVYCLKGLYYGIHISDCLKHD